jgi:hypothetical protein
MSNGQSNVERLVAAGVLDAADLTDEGRSRINGIDLSQTEIDNLRNIKEKLGLHPLKLSDPHRPGVWQL